jgi:hypothetical protein
VRDSALTAVFESVCQMCQWLAEHEPITVTTHHASMLCEFLGDVDNVSMRIGVMVSGRWLPETELQQRLKTLSNGSHQ